MDALRNAIQGNIHHQQAVLNIVMPDLIWHPWSLSHNPCFTHIQSTPPDCFL
ncbi:hypothetical protein [Undibacterium pigrum]|uniref:hypothetical protein n=1 Tax=Undibacterium pigrum TaxID=401470 RepID=UPI0014756900|nr:hypothetical protein [Undibacterium pigrum]